MATDKIILGLDPGTNVMGFGIISFKNQKLKALQYGVIKMNKEKDHIKKIYRSVSRSAKLAMRSATQRACASWS